MRASLFHGSGGAHTVYSSMHVVMRTPGRQSIYNLVCSMFESGSGNYATLRHVRAADSIGLLPVVTVLSKEHDDGSEGDSHKIWCLDCLEGIEALIREPGIFLDGAKRAALAELCEHFMQHYAALSHMCMEAGLCYIPFL